MKVWAFIGIGTAIVCLTQPAAWAESRPTDTSFVSKVRDQAVSDLHRNAAVSPMVKADLIRQGGSAYASWAMVLLQRPDTNPVVKDAILDNLYGKANINDVLSLLSLEPDIIAADLRLNLRRNVTAQDIFRTGQLIETSAMPRVGRVGEMPASTPNFGGKQTTDCVKEKMTAAGFGMGSGGGVTNPGARRSAGMPGEGGGGSGGMPTPPAGFDRTSSGAAGPCAGVNWSKLNSGETIGTQAPSNNTPAPAPAPAPAPKPTPDGDGNPSNPSHPSDPNRFHFGAETAVATPNPMAAEGDGGKSAEQMCMDAYKDCTSPEEKAANQAQEDCLKNKANIQAKLGPVAMPSGPEGFAGSPCDKNAYAGLDTTKMPNFGLTQPNPINTGDTVIPGPEKIDCSTPDPSGKPKPGCPGGGGASGLVEQPRMATPSLWQNVLRIGSRDRTGTRDKP